MTQESSPLGIRTFTIVWAGQATSLLGSGLATFALGVWVFQSTGSATLFGLMTFFATLPGLLMTPFAGVLVDRWDRRRTMILGDSVAGLTSAVLLLLVWLEALEVWHLYGIIAVNAAFSSLQRPAFTASVPLMVPKRHLGRVAGLSQVTTAASRILAPILAGALLAVIKLRGILVIDLLAMSFAVLTLLVVRIPRPPVTTAGRSGQGSFLSEAIFGWTYIWERFGLLALMILFAGVNFAMGIMQVLLTPLILSFSSEKALGTVLSIGAGGYLTGGVLMGIWGGPKKRIRGIFIALTLQGTILFLGGVRPSVPLVACAAFVFMFFMAVINASSHVIWQSKVAPDVMGRVFAIQQLVAFSSLPLAYVIAGPLADFVFEPWLAEGGLLADSVGAVIGVGPGRGIGFLYILLALVILLVVLLGCSSRSLRNLEQELPDAISDETATAAVD